MKNLCFVSALAIAMAAGISGANAAQTTTPATPSYAAPVIDDANAMRGADAIQKTSLRQQLQNQLEKAGYTQVKIMPSSFFVQAMDKKGEPVRMVIGPDSFAEVTDIPTKAAVAPVVPPK